MTEGVNETEALLPNVDMAGTGGTEAELDMEENGNEVE